jgi:pimeloyl-ACP methyl ester carboxylesterase
MTRQEKKWQIHGQRIAGLHWDNTRDGSESTKVIALHGWLDNAASFTRLAPLLDNCEVVALDLPGHGLSDHRSADASYHLWDDLPDIMAVADQLGWDRFALLGHSRGAIISVLLASAMPDRISHLLLLDAIRPAAIAHSETSQQLRQFILDKNKYLHRPHKLIANMEQAIERRCKAAKMSTDTARPIVERNLVEEPGGIRWTTDPRLNGASAFKLTAEHIASVLSAVNTPCRLILAEQGLGAHRIMAAVDDYPDIIVSILPGSHHFHLEAAVEQIASIFKDFLSSV